MLTQDQLDFFHTHGYLIMRGLIAGRELAVLQEQADQVIAQGLAGQGKHHRCTSCRRVGGSDREAHPSSDR